MISVAVDVSSVHAWPRCRKAWRNELSTRGGSDSGSTRPAPCRVGALRRLAGSLVTGPGELLAAFCSGASSARPRFRGDDTAREAKIGHGRFCPAGEERK
eukprot:scaffold22350_cov124-Isochrysis_galbana.AAC.4